MTAARGVLSVLRPLVRQTPAEADPTLPLLVCVPHAGGNAAAFQAWVRPVAETGFDLRAVQPRRSGAGLHTVDEVRERARELAVALELTDRPYVVLGHSFGAVLAYETVRQVELAGGRAPLRLVLCAAPPPRVATAYADLHRADDARLIALLRSGDGVPSALTDEELAAFLPLVRYDLAALAGHRPAAGPVRTPTHVVGAANDPVLTPHVLRGWADALDHPTYTTLPGRHFFLHDDVPRLLDQALTGVPRHGVTEPVPNAQPSRPVPIELAPHRWDRLRSLASARGCAPLTALARFVAVLLARSEGAELAQVSARWADAASGEVVVRVGPGTSSSLDDLLRTADADLAAQDGAAPSARLVVGPGEVVGGDDRAPVLSLSLAPGPGATGGGTGVLLAARLTVLLDGLAERPDTPLREVPLLPREEVAWLLDRHGPRREMPDLPLHALVAAQVARTPDATAVRACDGQLLYQELQDRADAVARRLAVLGVARDVVVGVCADRCRDLPAALLGILAAGGAYLPLDPHEPEPRLRHMLDAARSTLVLAQDGYRDRFARAGDGITVLDLQAQPPPSTGSPPEGSLPDGSPPPRSFPRAAELPPGDPLAYVIFTSGSTGQPKGSASATLRSSTDSGGCARSTGWAAGTSSCTRRRPRSTCRSGSSSCRCCPGLCCCWPNQTGTAIRSTWSS